MTERKRLCFVMIEHDTGRWTATEPNQDRAGNGDTAHEAIIDYVERAREDQPKEITA